jgi:indolepyruvate ferredoxin oxidoreductase
MVEVARSLGKLMAYKDEYEVARLYTDPAFMAGLRDQFEGSPKLKVYLGGVPLLNLIKDKKTGRPKKFGFPGWAILPVFGMLSKLKGLRGTPLDIFGYNAERKMERALIGEYRDLVRKAAQRVTPETMHAAIELAAAPELIAGYGPVKDEGVEAFRGRVAELMAKLETPAADAPSSMTEEPATA